ncbi:MAG: hypothetical protein ACRDSJ_06030, partial [Rubrobacteraceae bacterium]
MRRTAIMTMPVDPLRARDGSRARGALLVLALTVLFLTALLGARPAQAANFTVTSADDAGAGTLREAIAAANANTEADTITFDSALAGQTIELSTIGDNSFEESALAVTSDITIEGPTGDNGVTIARANAAPDMRLFFVGADGDLTLKNLPLRDGVARGGDG